MSKGYAVGRFILAIGLVALHLHAYIDILRSPAADVRLLPKWLWFLVCLLPIAGPVAYLMVGQPRVEPGQGGGGGGGSGGITGGPRPRTPLAPDDDPEFLKHLDEQSWAARMEALRRQRAAGGPPGGTSGPAPDAPPQPPAPPAPTPDDAPGEGATR